MKFSDLALPLDVQAAVKAQGYVKPTPIQTLVIPPALEGSDILGGAPTGTGKTAAFLLPVLARLNMKPKAPGVRALILEPTRELAQQVCADANKLCQALLKADAAGIGKYEDYSLEEEGADADADEEDFDDPYFDEHRESDPDELEAQAAEVSDHEAEAEGGEDEFEAELQQALKAADSSGRGGDEDDEDDEDDIPAIPEVDAKTFAEFMQGMEHFKAYTVIGGEGRDVQQAAVGMIAVATPGRLNEFIDKGIFDTSKVELLVIDEADRMLDMGFRDDVAAIVRATSRRYQTMLFSATLEGAGVREFAEQVLNDPFEVHLGSGQSENEKLPELLSSRAYYAANAQQKYNILAHLLRTASGKAIVFVRTKDRVNALCSFLRRNGVNAASLEGDMNITERKAALRRFKDNEVRMLVATDVAARGLDVPDVEQVYNFDLPGKADIYVHRAGRTARAGSKGTVISLVERSELNLLARIENYTGREIERRQIKNVCAAFPVEKTLPTKRESRASIGGKGGFDKRRADEKDDKKKVKERWRDKKNKGKPDFAAKRAKKAARLKASEAKAQKAQAAKAAKSAVAAKEQGA
ncbi:MAG: DEAD/DEAH box helicase [Proteobacteria bacterium]|uniref:DEAD/DEAH box helicase n=1 Tax=Candidatus Avisuccinivibrio stercorigallinarum TaxID=2840704 RepID=A0A9D9DB76_9GAMM|nr:DEAD/DEAH box helicase [Candidatus Avisuccinivibrio stercorigallinarum]